MALSVYFAPDSLTPDQYDEAIARLDAAGQSAPAGRLYHCAITADNDCICVFDVWESREAFAAFGETLMPILADLGVHPGPPSIHEVRNTIVG